MTGDLARAIAAIRTGEKERGRLMLAEIIRGDPRNEAAWLWMSAVLDSDAQRRECLERVLAFNPHNETALHGLAVLEAHEANAPALASAATGTRQWPVASLRAASAAAAKRAAVAQGRRSSAASAPAQPPPRSLDGVAALATRSCSYCAETIKAEASICRFCGRDLRRGQPAGPEVVAPAQPGGSSLAPRPAWSLGVAALPGKRGTADYVWIAGAVTCLLAVLACLGGAVLLLLRGG